MRPAPPMVVAVSCGLGERLALAALWATAAASIAAWAVAWFAPKAVAALGPVASLAAGLAATGAAALAAWRRRVRAPVRLRFDGAHWWIESADDEALPAGRTEPRARAGEIHVMLDLGGWMLLRLRTTGLPERWLGVGQQDAGAAWPQLRTTLYLYRTDAPGSRAAGT